MNFNFNNQRNIHMGNPLMRQFTTMGFIPAKSEFNKSDSILNGAQNRYFSSYVGNKSFSNPNFVNKQHPNILTSSVAGIINFDTPKLSHFYVQQPQREKSPIKEEKIQLESEINPSQLNTEIKPIINNNNTLISENMFELSPKSCKKNFRPRNRKMRRAKRAKDSIEVKSRMPVRIKCSSPKKFKKDFERGRTSKKWNEKDYEELPQIENCQSTPIDIKLPITFSPEVLNCLSSSTSSDALSFSPQSPAIHRIRLPSECDSEDSFIVFCDDVKDCTSEDFSDSELSDSCDSDFDCDFIEKTDLNREENRKRVSFKNDQELCQVHPMVKWDFAYREARKGPWEEMARDRARFRMRIQDTEFKLKKIFGQKHRDKIYKDRFEYGAF